MLLFQDFIPTYLNNQFQFFFTLLKYVIVVFRWLKCWNVDVPGQHKQRDVAKIWEGDALIAESGPFLFTVAGEKNCLEVRRAPWVYIDNLPNNVRTMLDNLLK